MVQRFRRHPRHRCRLSTEIGPRRRSETGAATAAIAKAATASRVIDASKVIVGNQHRSRRKPDPDVKLQPLSNRIKTGLRAHGELAA